MAVSVKCRPKRNKKKTTARGANDNQWKAAQGRIFFLQKKKQKQNKKDNSSSMETKRNPLSIDRWRRGGLLKDLRRRRTVSGLAAYELMEPSGPERERERERESDDADGSSASPTPLIRADVRPPVRRRWPIGFYRVFFYWVLPSRANGFARVGLSWLVGS